MIDDSAAAPSDPPPPITVEGIEIKAAGKGAYVVRALQPRIALGPDGKRATQLIEAGATGFFQLTAEWTVPPDRMAEVAKLLEQRDGGPVTLALAADTVSGTELQLKTDDGWVTAATGTAMGIPPQTSQLAATLDGDRLTAARRALSGEMGHARIVYRIDASDPVASDAGFVTAATAPGAATLTMSHTSSAGFVTRPITVELDLGAPTT